MSGVLIAHPGTAPHERAHRPPTLVQRALRARVTARLRGLRAGAIRLRDALGDELLGAPRGPLGTVTLDVHDPAFWTELVCSGDIGAGEGWVVGQWSCDDLVRLLSLFVRDRDVLLQLDRSCWSLPRRLLLRLGHRLRRNHRAGSRRNIADHYDLGDELFAQFLDATMTYSSAWFEHDDQSLADAQQHKLRRLCRLVDLAPGERLLEIGAGWGSLALCAAGELGALVTTTTISHRQFTRTRERVRDAGLRDRVEVLQRDYRDLEGSYDKVLSCEMIEAVGAPFLPLYLRTCAARLRPGGLLGLQAIVIAEAHYEQALRTVDYVKRHVFPGSFIPSVAAITRAAEQHTDLRVERAELFGSHYAATLRLWREAMLASPEPFLARGGPSLVRAWQYYFAYCEAGFRERHLDVVHLRLRRAGG